jgi:hypothetical protein
MRVEFVLAEAFDPGGIDVAPPTRIMSVRLSARQR